MTFRSLISAGVLALSAAFAAPLAHAEDTVSVQLDWVVRGNHAMFFVAQEKGYFKENGINITAIRKGTGTPDALRLVANGNADFGFGDLPTLAVSRSQGLPVVAIAAVNQHSPLAMISLANKKPLSKVADLKGMNIGIHPAGSTYVFFKALLAANGMSEADVTKSTVSPPYENYLLLGRVDAVPGYIDAEVPELEAKAGGKGSLSILLGADFGWPVYGSGVFTSEKLAKEKPDLAKRFMKAYLHAFADVIADPKGAADIIAKAAPEYANKKEVLVQQLEADIAATFSSDDTKANGLGTMTEARWQKTLDVLQQQGLLKAPVETKDVFTDDFLK
ncbi:ABC transporter substrate-binding protein [Dongia sedimenti]|uniref:ABC transporter substrate-binding protein n=1 Tax=Dongia sedimenti TaxID=3064282 RepID=A0ABU0YLU4_9PROT|nr:ABC transporter substrate-binding protein [Rhodospirillaceae bacterium R-7]